jgi:hypothetical protein
MKKIMNIVHQLNFIVKLLIVLIFNKIDLINKIHVYLKLLILVFIRRVLILLNLLPLFN